MRKNVTVRRAGNLSAIATKVHGGKLSATHDLKPLLLIGKEKPGYGWVGDDDATQQARIHFNCGVPISFKGRAAFHGSNASVGAHVSPDP